MINFLPFRALRYNSNLPLDKLIAPPYDVIQKEERNYFLSMHPYNITHLTLGDKVPIDYLEISKLFKDWIDKGILVFEEKGYFLYKQEYQWGNKIDKMYGLLGILDLQPLGENLLPHEHTFSGPKKDRLELLRNLRANLEPIWGIYEDKEGKLSSLWREIEKEKPLIKVTGWDYRDHYLWKINNESLINLIKEYLNNKKLLIADGHHRYEASWLYYSETKDEKAKYILMLITDLYDPGVKLLPTHRIVSKEVQLNIENLRKYFDIYLGEDIDELDLVFNPNKPFIYLFKENRVLKLFPNNSYINSRSKDFSELWWILPTTLLQKGIWEGILNTTENDLQEKGLIRFSHDIKELRKSLSSNEFGYAFILPSIPIEIVYALAINRERLPQKSTYFYPKPASGLALWKMDE